jgi:hypothetical protein
MGAAQMISTVIVTLTLLMAVVFSLAYALNPKLQQRVEAPKYIFLRQLSQYDRTIQDQQDPNSEQQ